jgi:hypothetical protein
VDIRFIHPHTRQSLLRAIELLAAEHTVTLEVIWSGSLVYQPVEAQLIQRYKAIVEEVTGKAILVKEHGASDGRYFSQE